MFSNHRKKRIYETKSGYEAFTEEKKTLFGEFWDNPKEFKFLPGEQEIMKQMRKISQKHLKKTSHKKTVRGRDSKHNESSIPIVDVSYLP